MAQLTPVLHMTTLSDARIDNGTDIDNWTFDDLMAVVYEFQAYYGAPIYQE
jgi:hypothetical protein